MTKNSQKECTHPRQRNNLQSELKIVSLQKCLFKNQSISLNITFHYLLLYLSTFYKLAAVIKPPDSL